MSEQKTHGLDKPTYGNIIIPSNTGFWGFPKELSNLAIVFIIAAFLPNPGRYDQPEPCNC